MRGKLKYIILIIAVLFLLIYFRYASLIKNILSPFFGGALLSYIAFPFVRMLTKKNVPKKLAIVFFYIIIILVFSCIIWVILPDVYESFISLSSKMPEYLDRINNFINTHLNKAVADSINRFFSELPKTLEGQFFGAFAKLGGAVNSLVNLVLAIVLSYYFISDIDKIKEGVLSLIPLKYHEEAIKIGRDINLVLARCIRGELTAALILAFLVSLYLSLLQIPYSIIFGLLTGIAEFIPYLGPFFSFLPIVLITLLTRPEKILYVAVGFLVLQQIEGNIITPKVVGKSVNMHPALTIFVVTTFARIFGIFGILIAVPTFSILRVIGKRIIAKIV